MTSFEKSRNRPLEAPKPVEPVLLTLSFLSIGEIEVTPNLLSLRWVYGH